MKNSKKYKLINKAKEIITIYSCGIAIDENVIEDLMRLCKTRTIRKYMKHVLRCGEFYNEQFYMPTTRKCLDTKLKAIKHTTHIYE